MKSIQKQLTLRGVFVGCVGCIVITTASAYTALKMGALPWPIIFAAIVSLFFLKGISKGKASLNEVNVTHTIMSAGAMVAGGLAFTIPAIWMLGLESQMSWLEVLIVALAGVSLGLVCTVTLRKHFIEDARLEYPIGEAAVQTLKAGQADRSTGIKLFTSMTLAGAYTALRDFFGLIPVLLFSNVSIPGVAFGIYNSPMMLAIGFIVGTSAVLVWFAGALFANFGIIVGGSALGMWDTTTAQGIVSSLGMGVMVGAGLGVIFKNILPQAWSLLKQSKVVSPISKNSETPTRTFEDTPLPKRRNVTSGLLACALAAGCLLICIGLQVTPLIAVVVVVLTWLTTAMSAQSVGQTGIDPMEIFGLLVLMGVAVLSDLAYVQLFYIAGIVAVACGLAGDVMNDFHAGHVLGTSISAQCIGQAIGALLGAIVSVGVMALLVNAYGYDAFGLEGEFIAAQASVVAGMVSGVPSLSSFILGLVGGLVLYFLNVPAMMLGLGIYLPFYLSFSAFLGCMIKVIYDALCKKNLTQCDQNEYEAQREAQQKTGLIISSGVLGGESIIGVLVALAAVLSGLAL